MGYNNDSDERELQYSQKYRPSTFMEYIGNQRVKERVHAALNSKAKPQVMLFSGASGCGKTTIARLIAKEYLCEDENKGETGACGVCPACKAVDEYIHTGNLDNLGEYYENLKEIDVADQSGKSAIDSVLQDAEIPAYSGWKIYIFDECHRASPQAQTRMLKIAEEPPENVLFIFCTTNPEEMLDTLVNRCQLKLEIKKPTVKAIDEDLALQYAQSKYDQYSNLLGQLKELDKELTLLHKTYIRGLGEMKLPVPSYPDANFTIRLTYGNVKPYDPKDGVHYNYYTTTKGILEKENPEDREFVVPAKLKELIEKKDYGRYALPNGDMPVCFLSTNDITGGNSGSPVLNENGELIGCAFDGNWESLSGDINFDNNLQRCINLDIRYVLFILDKLGGCGHLINEMTIVE